MAVTSVTALAYVLVVAVHISKKVRTKWRVRVAPEGRFDLRTHEVEDC
jgi:hypothetical protein